MSLSSRSKRRRSRTRRALAVVAAVVLVGVAAGAAVAWFAPPAAGGFLGSFRRAVEGLIGGAVPRDGYTEVVAGEPLGLNPLIFLDSPSQQAAALIFSGLTRLDATGGTLPGLATEWLASAGSRVWTFTLRRDATWHDGQPLTARDVSFTYASLASPDFPGDLRGEWRGVTARYIDDYTVVIELPAADPAFPVRATVPILPRHVLGGVAFRDWYTDGFNRNPTGCGPFRFAGWRTGESMDLEAYQGYYLGAPGLPRVTLRFAQLDGTAPSAFGVQAESIAALGSAGGGLVDPAAAAGAARLRGIGVARFPSTVFAALVANHRRPAGQLPVRRAIAVGLNIQRVTVAAAGALGGQTNPNAATGPLLVVGGPFIPGSAAAAAGQSAIPQQDANLARKLLSEAGWRDADADGALEKGNDVLRLGMLYPEERPDLAAAAAEISRQLAEFGIVVAARETSLNDYLAAWAPPFDFDLMLMEWVSAPGEDLYELFHSSQQPVRGAGGILRGGANVAGVADPQLDTVLADLHATPITDKATRDSLHKSLNALLADRAYQVFLWREAGFYARPSDLDGPQPGAFGLYFNIHEWRWRR